MSDSVLFNNQKPLIRHLSDHSALRPSDYKRSASSTRYTSEIQDTMGGTFSSLFSRLWSKKEIRILILGLVFSDAFNAKTYLLMARYRTMLGRQRYYSD